MLKVLLQSGKFPVSDCAENSFPLECRPLCKSARAVKRLMLCWRGSRVAKGIRL